MDKNPTVVFAKPKEVVLEERDVPSPKSGQLLIKTRRTLISTGTELTILNGQFPRESRWAAYGKFPFLPGYNNIGEVVDVGPDADKAWVGTRVATSAGHSQYVIVPAKKARRIQRDELEDEEAVFFTIAEVVMNGVRRGSVLWGESAVIFGMGLLGQFAARFCRIAGARPVVAVDISANRLGYLPDDPALVKLNPAEEDPEAAVAKLTRGRKADVVFELTGNQDLIPDQFKVLRTQGRYVILSSPRGETTFDFHDLCNAPSYTIIGAHSGSHPKTATLDNPWTNQRDAELFFDLVADKEIDVRPLISHREPYTKAGQLYNLLLEDRSRAMGVVMEW